MGDEAVANEGDKFVENATVPEPAGELPPEEKPVEGEKPEEKEAGELSGDENADEVEQFLRKKYGQSLRANDLEQMMRWRRQATEGKKASGRLKEFEEASKKGVPSERALHSLAKNLGPGYREKLQELGSEEFVDFVTATGKYSKESQASTLGLDPNDPKDQMLQHLMEWKTKTEQSQAQEAESKALMEKSKRFAANLTAAVEKLELKTDAAKMIVWRLADSLYAEAGHDPGAPDAPEIKSFAAEAKKLLEKHGDALSSKEDADDIQATPRIPAFAKSSETSGREREDDDEDDAEERSFIDRGTAGKGG